MSDNLRHWEALCHTDKAATKPFDRGRFKGTATNPIWREWLLTEHFGPCGIGWGMNPPEFTLVPAGDELVVFCTVALWYSDEGEKAGYVYGVGGDKVIRVEKNGPFISDEAYKAAFTDALGNAMKHIGVGADIMSGEFDADKYTRPTSAATRNAAVTHQGPFDPRTGLVQPTGETPKEKVYRIRRAFEVAEKPEEIDNIKKTNAADLVLIEAAAKGAKTLAGQRAYVDLILYAEQRKKELAQPIANGPALAEGLREALGQP
jgi:hypothetical protein